MATHNYQPLDPDQREIRLLYFKPSSHLEAGAPVRCVVKHVSLSKSPNVGYDAISYCWGEDPGSSSIILDGTEVIVPGSALLAIRGTHRTTESLRMPVWIDAICINQSEVEEKNQQVAIMGEIY